MSVIQLPEKHIPLYIGTMGLFTLNHLLLYLVGVLFLICNIITATLMLFLFVSSIIDRETKSKGMGKWNWLFIFAMVFVFMISGYEVYSRIC